MEFSNFGVNVFENPVANGTDCVAYTGGIVDSQNTIDSGPTSLTDGKGSYVFTGTL